MASRPELDRSRVARWTFRLCHTLLLVCLGLSFFGTCAAVNLLSDDPAEDVFGLKRLEPWSKADSWSWLVEVIVNTVRLSLTWHGKVSLCAAILCVLLFGSLATAHEKRWRMKFEGRSIAAGAAMLAGLLAWIYSWFR